jgi:hypothetical protein
MKTREWQNLFAAQAKLGKVVFTPTELSNASGVPRQSLNVELTRLVKYGAAIRYAKGLYGPFGSLVPLELLLPHLDPHAYITGLFALMKHGVVTQVPVAITCFTSRRHFSRDLQTPAGRLEFVCVKPPIYRREERSLAGPELALCDFAYLALRRGQDPAGLATFRRLNTLKRSVLTRIMKRYPVTVRQCVTDLLKRA